MILHNKRNKFFYNLKLKEDILACYYQGRLDEYIPKVSDIDLIIITKEKVDIKGIKGIKEQKIDFSFYSEKIWRKGVYIKPLFNDYIIPIFEKKTYLPYIWEKNQKKNKLIYLSHILDYSYLTFFSWLNKIASKVLNRKTLHSTSIKELLKRLNGLKYLVIMYNYLIKDQFKTDIHSHFFEKVRKLREYSCVKQEELLKLVKYAYKNILFDILKSLVNYIRKNTLKSFKNNKKFVFVGYISGRNFILYVPSFFIIFENAERWIYSIIELNKVFRENILILPLELSINLIYYSQTKNGVLKNKIKKHLIIKGKIDFELTQIYTKVLKEKYRILEDWIRYIRINKIGKGFRPFEYRYTTTFKDFLIEGYFYIKHIYQKLILNRILRSTRFRSRI